ncbi:MAG: hypothetical protein M1833_004504 [Piccolia ochrophora]|nr:MAG: hypothetical protein M1833_004504 [Piccolia ochrophora]
MVVHNPKNWHWVSKDASTWTRNFLDEHLLQISAKEDGVTATVDKILSMDGDVDVSQRKGKVLTLFDVKVVLEYSGNASTGEEVSGTITIPEVAHDTEEDEYVFDVDIYSDASSKQPVKDLIRRKLVPQLRTQLGQLGPALIGEHGKDLQHGNVSDESSGVSTPISTSHSSSNAQTKGKGTVHTSSAPQGGDHKALVNVTTVTDTEEFRTTAEELFQTFTDPQRITAFTRGPPKVFEGAEVGKRFEIFDGNVAGKFIELQKPTAIVQRWRLKQWPPGHYSSLQIKFDQNDQDAVTVMRVTWDGVPVGQEEVTKRNWREYYVRSIKTTFGFGTVL